jgi:chromosomal replication initiation ATPase DnaA
MDYEELTEFVRANEAQIKEILYADSSEIPPQFADAIYREFQVLPCDYHKGKSRSQPMPLIRFIYFYYIRKVNNRLTLTDIGRLQGKNYATVLQGIRVINNLLEVKSPMEDYNRVKNVLKTLNVWHE